MWRSDFAGCGKASGMRARRPERWAQVRAADAVGVQHRHDLKDEAAPELVRLEPRAAGLWSFEAA